MFSYLQAVQSLASINLYQRGLRIYLDGKVVGHTELILDFWRQYEVSGQNNQYLVKIPLIHLALSRNKWSQGSQALAENVFCSCNYFAECGACKHIVAVCASLEQEFGPKQSTDQTVSPTDENFLQNLFAYDLEKKQRLWLQFFEKSLVEPTRTYSQQKTRNQFIVELSEVLSKESTGFDNFWQQAGKAATKAIQNYEYEKNVVDFATQMITLGGQIWWNFWREFLAEMLPQNQNIFFLSLFLARQNYPLRDFFVEIEVKMDNLSPTQKEEIITILKQKYSQHTNLVVEFCFSSHYWSWLEKNLNRLETETLLQMLRIWPEKTDFLERMIFQQLKVWVEFLPSHGSRNYQQLVEVLHQWQLLNDSSELLLQLIEYIKQVHPKKTALLREINDF